MRLTKSKKDKNAEQTKFVPFEEANVIQPLKMFLTIVPFGQAEAIVKVFESCGATTSIITSAEGTGRNFMPGLISIAESKKQMIISFIKENKSDDLCKALKERFSTSKAARGISISTKLTSVAGVSVYKFLSNMRKVTKVK